MFALNRRHWFAGVAAFALSSRMHRGAQAAQETPAMPEPTYLPIATTNDPFADVPYDDLLLDVAAVAVDFSAYWLRPLQAVDALGYDVLARERADLAQAIDRLIDACPNLSVHVGELNAVHDAINAVEANAWSTALIVGHVLGQRDAPTIVHFDATACRTCDGSGRLWDGHATRPVGATKDATSICPACEGHGYRPQGAAAAFHPKRVVSLPTWVPDPEGLTRGAWLTALGEATMPAVVARRNAA